MNFRHFADICYTFVFCRPPFLLTGKKYSTEIVPVVDVRRAFVQDAFRSSNRLSRFDIAHLISERYPELRPRLPAKRKLGYGEPFQIRMFHAVSVGMAFLRISDHSVDGRKT